MGSVKPYEMPGWCDWQPVPLDDDWKVTPSTREITAGLSPDSKAVSVGLCGRNTLILGGEEAERQFLLDHLLGEAIQVPVENRIFVYVDTFVGLNSLQWAKNMDAVSTKLEDTYELLLNLHDEMDRRRGVVLDHYEEYLCGTLFPSNEHKMIVLVVNDLATLYEESPTKDEDVLRRKVIDLYETFVVDTNYNQFGLSVIACMGSLPVGFNLIGYQNRFCGCVPSCDESSKMLGDASLLRDGIDASKLHSGWFYLAKYYVSSNWPQVRLLKPYGDVSELDLCVLSMREELFAPAGRGSWLLAEHGTLESKPYEWRTFDEKYAGTQMMGFSKDTRFDPIEG